MDQLNKAYANKHYPNIKEYVSTFGNIDRCGHVCEYAAPGVHLDHWVEIPFSEFAAVAAPEALVIIEFIKTHNRLPNFITAHWAYKKLYRT